MFRVLPREPEVCFAPTQSETLGTETAYEGTPHSCHHLAAVSLRIQSDIIIPGEILEANMEGASVGSCHDPCSSNSTRVSEDLGVKAMRLAMGFAVNVLCSVSGSWLTKPSAPLLSGYTAH